MALEKELETYVKELPRLSCHEGKFVLIHDGTVEDVFGTYEDALKEGYERFGLDAFLVKEIHTVEQIQYFTRDLKVKCHT